MKEDRDEPGREQREDDISLCLYERPQSDDDQHIQPDDAQSQRTIDQSAIDDEIDVPQTIAQQRDADAEMNGRMPTVFSNR